MKFLGYILPFIFFIFFTTCKATEKDIPDLTSPVMDPAGLLPIESKIELETILLEYQKETSHQIVVYITPKIRFDTIEEEASVAFEKWKLGVKDKDNGILYLLAPNDKKVRIEVGYGLESIVTDVTAKRIIDEIIIPRMKVGEIATAVKQGTLVIIDQINSGSPSLLIKSCPKSFSDIKDWLHPDTIPMLQKEIKSRKAIRNYDIRFCISDVNNALSLEAQAYGILKNINSEGKPGLAFLTCSDGNLNFIAKIATDSKLSWLLSENKKNEIFRNQYSYMREGDMTNYSYQSMIEIIDALERWESTSQILAESTGLQDPYSTLVQFSSEYVNRSINNIETDLNVPISVLILKTKADLESEAKKYHHQIFKNGNGVVLLISLTEKNLFIYTNENTIFPNKNEISDKINNIYLTESARSAANTSLKKGDIDWITSYATDSLYYEIKNYYLTKERAPNTNSIAKNIQKVNPTPALWQGIKALMVFLGFLMYLIAEGIPFFTILFYFLINAFREKIFFLAGDFSYSIEIILLSSCGLISFVFVMLCRKLDIAEPVSSFVESSSEYIGELRGSGSSSGSSSYRSSSSSSSYSGGGGRSGGGGASGSW